MSWYLWVLASFGLVAIGVAIGVLVTCLMVAASEADDGRRHRNVRP